MGVIELQIARHADEQGRLEALEIRTEAVWLDIREGLADQLATGETIKVNGRPLLDFENVEGWLFDNKAEEVRQAMILCAINEGLGGKHMKRLIEEAALALVNLYSDNFKQEIRSDLSKGGIA